MARANTFPPVGPMLLHVHEWGDPGGEPLVCLHGVTGYAGVYQRLAEDKLPSLSIGIVHDQQLVLAKAYGNDGLGMESSFCDRR